MYEKCGECAFHSFENGDWICTCKNSEYYGEYTDYNDKCEEFEERRIESREEKQQRWKARKDNE